MSYLKKYLKEKIEESWVKKINEGSCCKKIEKVGVNKVSWGKIKLKEYGAKRKNKEDGEKRKNNGSMWE